MKMPRQTLIWAALLAACVCWVAPVHAQSAPVVTAGNDQVVSTNEVFLAGGATDDDTPSNNLVFTWTMLEGPDDVIFDDQDQPNTRVEFTLGKVGVYVFQLEASDGALSGFDTVEVVYGPLTFQIPGFQATFFFDTAKNKRSKFKFVLTGQNNGDEELDLRAGDKLVFLFGGTDPLVDGLTIGRLGVTVDAGGDWVAMDIKQRTRATNKRGELFDGTKSTFKKVKARYKTRLFGQLKVSGSGGVLTLPADDLPDPGPVGSVAFEIMPVAVMVERRQSSEPLELLYFQFLTFEVKKNKRGISYKSQ